MTSPEGLCCSNSRDLGVTLIIKNKFTFRGISYQWLGLRKVAVTTPLSFQILGATYLTIQNYTFTPIANYI